MTDDLTKWLRAIDSRQDMFAAIREGKDASPKP